MQPFPAETLEEVLEDLQSRFIINVPDEELSSVERICFQIEQAHWFYEDFVREQNSRLPSLSLKSFSGKFFAQCPLLKEFSTNHEEAFQTFLDYKVRVPVCGAIILNEKMDSALLVRGWKASAGWGFPKGKINRDEGVTACAIREVLEETGFDISSYLNEDDFVERTIKEQTIRLYIIRGIGEKTVFITKTRKEIGAIQWHKIKELPGCSDTTPLERGRYYMVVPFMTGLKRWISKHRRVLKKSQKLKQKSSDPGTGSISGYKSGTDWEYRSSTDLDSEIEMSMSTAHPFHPHLIDYQDRLSANKGQQSILMQIFDSQSNSAIQEYSTSTSNTGSSQSQQPSASELQARQKHLLQLLNIKPNTSIDTAPQSVLPTTRTTIDASQSIKALLGIGTPNIKSEGQPPVMSGPSVNSSHQQFTQTIPPTSGFALSSYQQSPMFVNVTPITVTPNADEVRSAHKESLLAILKGVPEPPKAFPSSLSRSSTFMGVSEENQQFNSRMAIANLLLSSALSPAKNNGKTLGRKLSIGKEISMFERNPSGHNTQTPNSDPIESSTTVQARRKSNSSISGASDRSINSPMDQIMRSQPNSTQDTNPDFKRSLLDIIFSPQNNESARRLSEGNVLNISQSLKPESTRSNGSLNSFESPLQPWDTSENRRRLGVIQAGSELKRLLGISEDPDHMSETIITNKSTENGSLPTHALPDERSSISLKQLLGVVPISEDEVSNTSTIRESQNESVQTDNFVGLNMSNNMLDNDSHKKSLIALLTGGSALDLGIKTTTTFGTQGRSPN
ncbi:mRNA-decapping enzyme subunit 2 [Nowakowskiella sp. JEL0078]|nr:mRNA-decapping enzyme subunit 2 [Nowakowskiella sp. JEL0078]